MSKVTGQDKEETQSGEEQALAYEGLKPQDALERFNENQENYLDMGHMKAIILENTLWKTEMLWRDSWDFWRIILR